MRFFTVIVFLFCTVSAAAEPPSTQPSSIHWQPYSDELFAQAKMEHKLIILDLEAVWCHWCHVQDETTYGDPAIQKLIGDHFLAIKVDQDSRPDISNRYEDYGWPATIVFDYAGKEIVKRRGYLPPAQMEAMLKAVIADPTPGPSIQPPTEIHAATQPVLALSLTDKLNADVLKYYDDKNGGWGRAFKFIDADLIEYCTLQDRAGNRRFEQMARGTVTAGLKLIDPAWGGVYQYSTDGDWDHPHFEKIMSYQADDMRTFARSYAVWHDPAYLAGAQAVHRFLKTFLLSPEGGFYTSQDADRTPGVHGGDYFSMNDAGRRKLGVPRIDTHIYSRENGWAIGALVAMYQYTKDASALAEANCAAEWIIAHRGIPGGGFHHGDADPSGPYLNDTLAMGRAFLALYSATADRIWLDRAIAAEKFIEQHFTGNKAGVLTVSAHAGDAFPVEIEVDENIAVARLGRLLYGYTGQVEHEKLAELAMRYLAAPEVAGNRNWLVGGILLADQEMNTDPPHITIVGSRNDPAAKNLFDAAGRLPLSYKRLEWYDHDAGPLMRMNVEYPILAKPAAFVCESNACSTPIFDSTKLETRLRKIGTDK